MIKRLFSVLAWNLGLLAVVLSLVEAIFGGWFDAVSAPNLWRLSIYRNVDWKLDTSHLYAGAGASTARYIRDRWGFRGAYGAPEDIDILVIGGSTTDERFIDEDKTWTKLLQTCLANTKKPLRIANAGVGGQSTRGHIRNFDVWFSYVPSLKPKYILAYIGVNETLLDGRKTEDDALAYNESGHALWWERAKLNSALYGLFRTAIGNLAAFKRGYHHIKSTGAEIASAQIDRRWHEEAGKSVMLTSEEYAQRLIIRKQEMHGELEAYSDRLQRLVGKIREMGAEPILITQTKSDWRIMDGVVLGSLGSYFEMRAINDATLSTCQSQGVRCFDLALDMTIQDNDFYDSVHVTPQGSARVAEYLCEKFRELE